MTSSAPTTGWVAIGFNDQASMTGADMIIGWVADGTKRQSKVVVADSISGGNVSEFSQKFLQTMFPKFIVTFIIHVFISFQCLMNCGNFHEISVN